MERLKLMMAPSSLKTRLKILQISITGFSFTHIPIDQKWMIKMLTGLMICSEAALKPLESELKNQDLSPFQEVLINGKVKLRMIAKKTETLKLSFCFSKRMRRGITQS